MTAPKRMTDEEFSAATQALDTETAPTERGIHCFGAVVGEAIRARESEARLKEALLSIDALLCDKDLCGHFTAEEIREQTQVGR